MHASFRHCGLLALAVMSTAAHGQAYEDLMRQGMVMQAKQSVVDGTIARAASVPNPDMVMQDRLEQLVVSGKCDEATATAKRYRNKILIKSVADACGS